VGSIRRREEMSTKPLFSGDEWANSNAKTIVESEDSEFLAHAIAVGLQVPREYLEPSLSTTAKVLSAYEKAEKAKGRELLYKELDKELAKLHAEIASLRGSIAALSGILYATRTIHLVRGAVRRTSYNGRKKRA
jgi:hypothetical protein